MLSLSKASLKALRRNPSAIIFNILFPLIFIIVFGFISEGRFSIEIAFMPGTDMNNVIIKNLKSVNSVKFIENLSGEDMLIELERGRIDAVISINKNADGNSIVLLKTSKASPERGNVFKLLLSDIVDKQNLADSKTEFPKNVLKEEIVEGRKFRTIDFILPGQLGFSLLSSGVFGTAFIFLSLRQTLVIKRFFATPVKKMYIILGESLSRLVFTISSSVIIILIGYFVFGFTLINGIVTFGNMLLLSVIAMIVFFGFGFIVSGIAKNEAAVPAIANLITLPQFLLAGTFFPISNFPEWLQPVSRVLPLTYLNGALRKISFEGAGLFDVKGDIFIMLIWGVVLYAVAVRVFKWE